MVDTPAGSLSTDLVDPPAGSLSTDLEMVDPPAGNLTTNLEMVDPPAGSLTTDLEMVDLPNLTTDLEVADPPGKRRRNNKIGKGPAGLVWLCTSLLPNIFVLQFVLPPGRREASDRLLHFRNVSALAVELTFKKT